MKKCTQYKSIYKNKTGSNTFKAPEDVSQSLINNIHRAGGE